MNTLHLVADKEIECEDILQKPKYDQMSLISEVNVLSLPPDTASSAPPATSWAGYDVFRTN
jgi:hypothetical protein